MLRGIIDSIKCAACFLGKKTNTSAAIIYKVTVSFVHKVSADDRIGAALYGVTDVVHVICFSLLKVLEHIGKRAARLQKRLALLVRQIVVLQSQDDILSHRELIAVIEDFIRRLR